MDSLLSSFSLAIDIIIIVFLVVLRSSSLDHWIFFEFMVVVQIHGFCWVLEYYSILFVFLYFFDYFLTVFLFISSSYFLSFLSFNPSSTTVYSSTQHSIFLLQLNVFLSLLTSCNFGGCSKNDVWGRIRVKCIVHL